MKNWFGNEYFDSKIIIFTARYGIGVSNLMMTTEICLGPVSLFLTNFDGFSTVSIECVASKSKNKNSAIQKHCPIFKILKKKRNENDEMSRKKMWEI